MARRAAVKALEVEAFTKRVYSLASGASGAVVSFPNFAYRANREAAFSLGLLDLSDDAGVRTLYGGLSPDGQVQP